MKFKSTIEALSISVRRRRTQMIKRKEGRCQQESPQSVIQPETSRNCALSQGAWVTARRT